MQAIIILLSLTALTFIISGIVFGGFHLLQYLSFISSDIVFSYSRAFNIGEYITLGIALVIVIISILNKAGVIDLSSLKKGA